MSVKVSSYEIHMFRKGLWRKQAEFDGKSRDAAIGEAKSILARTQSYPLKVIGKSHGFMRGDTDHLIFESEPDFVEPDALAETKFKLKPKPKPKPKPESKSELKSESKEETKPEAETTSKPSAKTQENPIEKIDAPVAVSKKQEVIKKSKPYVRSAKAVREESKQSSTKKRRPRKAVVNTSVLETVGMFVINIFLFIRRFIIRTLINSVTAGIITWFVAFVITVSDELRAVIGTDNYGNTVTFTFVIALIVCFSIDEYIRRSLRATRKKAAEDAGAGTSDVRL